MGKPVLPEISTLIQAGIDPKTGLPLKFGGGCKAMLKEDLKKFLKYTKSLILRKKQKEMEQKLKAMIPQKKHRQARERW